MVETTVGVGTKLGHGFQVMILGLAVVFVGLIILIGAVYLMNYLFDRFSKKEAVSAAPAAQIPAVAPVAAGLQAVPAAKVIEEAATGELATVAGLTAVIMASADTGKDFVVRAIRKVEGSAWKRA